jgi:Predicted ABC-type transport system involved in lysophospholipase L1 biosynthesis, permease component
VGQLAAVKRVACSMGTPFSRGSNNTMAYNGKSISAQMLHCDSVFFNMLGFEVIHRNNNNSGWQFFANEQMLLETELPIDVKEIIFEGGNNLQITGIIRDFQLYNITHKKQPVFVIINPDFDPWNILIETQGDPFVARNQIKEVYERISLLEFTGEYLDEQIEKSFAEQSRLTKLVIVFTIIAIIISLLGLLAMSTYFIQQRSREVSVRKVFGSTNKEVLVKLVTTFLNYVLIAFVIATPVIWYIMKGWLSDYSYRITLYPWIFGAAGLFCFLIAFVTVFFQSWRAANANPASSIKTE